MTKTQRQLRRIAAFRAAGLCLRCGKQPPRPARTTCAACGKAHSVRTMRWQQRARGVSA